MKVLIRIFRSSLGKKYVMAMTGLVLFVFVIGHMAGNLQIFLGAEPINAYALFLKSKPGLLWTARLSLLLVAVLHIVSALELARENRAARPVPYELGKPTRASFASRTILASGLIVLAFIVYHLMHFTIGAVNHQLLELEDSSGRHDVYRMMVTGFSNPLVSALYMLSMGLLCLHLSHGVTSMFQSVGLKNEKYATAIDRFAKISALVIFIGNSSIPVAILAGWVK
jgi:succinate dehydrogenase / fumarate reductase cytochrome b subunit